MFRSLNELPSVALTQRFLSLCEDYGSQRLVIRLVASGRNIGVPGLPETDDWTTWDADQMRAAVEHLEQKRGIRGVRSVRPAARTVRAEGKDDPFRRSA